MVAGAGMKCSDGTAGVWLLGSAAGQPDPLGSEMPPPPLCCSATASSGMMPLDWECGCARRREGWREKGHGIGEGREQ